MKDLIRQILKEEKKDNYDFLYQLDKELIGIEFKWSGGDVIFIINDVNLTYSKSKDLILTHYNTDGKVMARSIRILLSGLITNLNNGSMEITKIPNLDTENIFEAEDFDWLAEPKKEVKVNSQEFQSGDRIRWHAGYKSGGWCQGTVSVRVIANKRKYTINDLICSPKSKKTHLTWLEGEAFDRQMHFYLVGDFIKTKDKWILDKI